MMAEAKADQAERNIWKVVKVVPENGDINSVYLEGFDEKFSKRAAGQFASIMIRKPEGWSEAHPFTISAAPEDKLLRFTIKKEGAFTSDIPNLKPGTEVRCTGPLGVFCKGIDGDAGIVMMAGGVGVTPFLSVLRHFRYTKAAGETTLFWVNKTMAETFAADEIGAMTQELNLTVVHCLSREDDVQRHFQPRFPRVLYEKGRLNADILTRHGAGPGAAFYLCGPPPMMDAALTEVGALGVDPASVRQEKFSYQKPAR
jgi:predicted ferric reductase